MVRVVGPLRVVTDRPLLVSQVRVRAARDRAEHGGLTAAFDDSVPVTDGQLDMVVLPGPAVMMLEVTGGFSHAVKLVVPDVAEATLEQCVTAAEVAGEADRRTLERLAGEVARDALAVSEAAGRAETAAASAQSAADAAKRATPSWTSITGKPSVFPPASHMHSATDVRATLNTDSGSTTRTVQEHLQDLYDKLRRLDAGTPTQPEPEPEPQPAPEPDAAPFAIAYNGPTATTIEDVLKLRRGQWAALNELIELSNRKTDPATYRNRALATREIGAAIGIGALPDTSFITSDAVANFRLSAIAAASKDTSDYTTISAQIAAFDAAVKAKEVTL